MDSKARYIEPDARWAAATVAASLVVSTIDAAIGESEQTTMTPERLGIANELDVCRYDH